MRRWTASRPQALVALLVIGHLAGVIAIRAEKDGRARPATGETPAAIVLPQKLVAGQGATLAVLTADGRIAPGVTVQFSGGQSITTDSSGRAFFTAPAEAGVVLVGIPSAGADAQVGASATVLATGGGSPLQILQVPRMVSLRDRFFVNGTGFQSAAEGNRVEVGSLPAPVLASSPVSLVVVAGPKAAPGQAQISVQAGGASATASTTLVALELEAGKGSLAPKEKTKLSVHVRGTEQAVELEASNQSPDVVRLTHGAERRVISRGGADNSAFFEIEGVRQGDFAFSVRLVPPPAGQPDIEAALQYLHAARRQAPEQFAGRVDKLIRRLEKHPEDATKVRTDLEKLMARKLEGQFGRLVESAWEVLLNR